MQRRCVEADMLIAKSALATVDLAVSTVLMTLPQSNLCRTSDTLSDPTPHLKEQLCDIDALRFHRPDNPMHGTRMEDDVTQAVLKLHQRNFNSPASSSAGLLLP